MTEKVAKKARKCVGSSCDMRQPHCFVLFLVGADSISARHKAIFSAVVPAGSFHRFAVPLPPGGRHFFEVPAHRHISKRAAIGCVLIGGKKVLSGGKNVRLFVYQANKMRYEVNKMRTRECKNRRQKLQNLVKSNKNTNLRRKNGFWGNIRLTNAGQSGIIGN